MGIAHLLEDFAGYTRGKPVSLTDVSLEEQRLEAFEKGYQAGWDDSAAAASEDSRHVAADLAQNLNDLTFTYQEAHAAVLASLRPLLEQMMETILPALMRKTLGAQVVDLVHDLAKSQGALPVELVTSPANVSALLTVLGDEPSIPVTVTEEDALAEGQVFVRMGQQEREINLSAVIDAIEQTTAGFFNENQRETA